MLNYVDIILALIILLGVYHGWYRGFILGSLEIVALVLSILVAFLSYQYVSSILDHYFDLQERWLLPVSFLICVIFARLIIGTTIYTLVKNISYKTHQSSLNKTLGLLPGSLRGFFYAALFAIVFLFIPLWPNLTAKTRDSQLADLLTQQIEEIDQKIAPDISEKVKKSISKLTIEPESDETVYLHFKVSDSKPNEKFENRLLILVNQERRKAGLRILERDTSLRSVARAHSKDMFEKGYFSHINLKNKTPFDRMRGYGIKYKAAGENLALAQTVEIAHLGLMNSPGHKANILSPKFNKVGVGIMDGGIYGIMVTQNFKN